MKTRIFLIMLLALALFSCQKEKTDPATEQDVSFTAIQLTPDVGLKSTADVIPCKSDIPDYAAVKINGIWYYPALFTLDGKLYTQAIKFPVGAYTVTEFFLYKNMGGTTGYDDSDIIVFATPMAGVDFDEFLTIHLPFTFTVEAFKKAQIEIEVLCFQDHFYTEFGFIWFHITEIIVREQCFFGDICFKHYLDYEESHYALQPGGLKIDMPAIMMLKVYKNGVLLPAPYDVFTNDTPAANYGEGAPLCIVYPDNLSIPGEVFTVELYIMVKQGDAFPFILFHTFTFTDDQMIPAGADGVVDFVLGNCNLTTPDLQLAPWQNLPLQANVTIWYPSTINHSYWDIRFNTYTPAGEYDLPDVVTPVMPAWCGDKFHTIAAGSFDAWIYPSLYDVNWPAGMPFNKQQIATVNWLMNNLAAYNITIGLDYGGDGGKLQQAIWKLLNNVTPTDTDAAQMAADAASHTNFVPLPGGWAAVLVVKNNLPLEFQLIFVVVDP